MTDFADVEKFCTEIMKLKMAIFFKLSVILIINNIRFYLQIG